MRHRFGGLVLAWAYLIVGRDVWAQEGPSVETIVSHMQQKNVERQGELESYTSERTYRVEYHGVGGEHRGEIHVHVEYGSSGAKHMTVVSESGSNMICERVLRRMVETEETASDRAGRMQTTLSPENYSFELLGHEPVDGVESWILSVSPKMDNKLTYRGRIWVSEDDFAVVRVQGEPAKNPSFWINHSSFDWHYGRHGQFWLPEKSTALSHVRIGGEAKLTIEYGQYNIVAQPQTAQRRAEGTPVPVARSQLPEHGGAQ